MNITTTRYLRPWSSALLCLAVHSFLPISARAELFSLSASGKIAQNTIAHPPIPVGTPCTFELFYDPAAADRDFELTGAPDPSFGRFTNGGAVPALTFFH